MTPRLPWTVLATALALALVTAGFLAGCGGSEEKPRTFAAGRKHLAVPSPPARLPVVASTRGPNDPHDFDLLLLIPHGTRLRQVWFIHGGRKPDQVLVEWVRSRIASLYSMDFPENVPWGLTLWTQTPHKPNEFQAPWKGVAIPLLKSPPGAPEIRVAFADVTSDRHPDVLVEQYPGTNHGCGPHQVVATLSRGKTWRIFRSSLCESTLRGSKGLLALDMPYYLPGDSVCCWSKVEKLRLRWSGKRYVTVSDVIVSVRR
jgi:hypothetical protein